VPVLMSKAPTRTQQTDRPEVASALSSRSPLRKLDVPSGSCGDKRGSTVAYFNSFWRFCPARWRVRRTRPQKLTERIEPKAEAVDVNLVAGRGEQGAVKVGLRRQILRADGGQQRCRLRVLAAQQGRQRRLHLIAGDGRRGR